MLPIGRVTLYPRTGMIGSEILAVAAKPNMSQKRLSLTAEFSPR